MATPQNEGTLLELAVVATGAQLERLCRGYRAVSASETAPEPEERSVHRRLLPRGMVKLQAGQAEPAKDPSAEAAGVSAETCRPSQADGAVTLAESFSTGHPVDRSSGGERFQVMVHLGQETLGADGEWSATLEDGTRVSAETLRRVACDCGLLAAGGEGENLNIGHRTRSIPPAIRRALMARDRGCAFPGCTHTRFLHGHHIEHWLHGGETRLDNMLLLCTLCRARHKLHYADRRIMPRGGRRRRVPQHGRLSHAA